VHEDHELIIIGTLYFGLQPPADFCGKLKRVRASRILRAAQRFEWILHANSLPRKREGHGQAFVKRSALVTAIPSADSLKLFD
jgi:hypothetical protein